MEAKAAHRPDSAKSFQTDPSLLFLSKVVDACLLVAAVLALFPVLAVAYACAAAAVAGERWWPAWLTRLLSLVPVLVGVAWLRLHFPDDLPPYLDRYGAALRLAGTLLLARLHGAPLAWAPWAAFLAVVWPYACLGSLWSPFIAPSLRRAFQRSRFAPPLGEANGNGRERERWGQTAEPLPAAIMGAPGLLRHLSRQKTVPCLVGAHFAIGAVSILHGPSSAGKSRFLSEVVRAMIRGEALFGWPTLQSPVVWVTEESLSVFRGKLELMVREKERQLSWWACHQRSSTPRRYEPTVWPVSLPNLGLTPGPETFDVLLALAEQTVKRTGAKLVIFDTLLAMCPQAAQNNEVAKRFMGRLADLAIRLDVAVELVHHDNNDGEPLGAKMVKGAADYTHHLTRLEGTGEDDPRRTLTFGKRYEPQAPPPIVYRMNDAGRLELVPDQQAPRVRSQEERGPTPAPATLERTARDVALEAIRHLCATNGQATSTEVKLVSGLPKTNLWRVLQALQDQGEIVCVAKGTSTEPARWTLPAPHSPTMDDHAAKR